MRWITAGESHGPALVGVVEGLPGIRVAETAAVTVVTEAEESEGVHDRFNMVDCESISVLARMGP